MRLQNTVTTLVIAMTLVASNAFAQSKQYQRKKPAEPSSPTAPTATAAAAKGDKPAAASGTAPDSEKLDISELEQKYWAPKDTDFSVVQNRTYTKAKRFAFSAMTGPIMNDPYNDGFAFGALGNYYFDERYGVEFQYISSDLKDSDATKEFTSALTGGSRPPDFNRPVSFYGIGFNWVPFYAKMSVLGSKIIYFDMQFTPLIGMSTYEQQAETGALRKEKTAFTYGFDVTQYFFVHKNFAYRFNYQNRWSQQDIIGYQSGTKVRDDRDNTSFFLFGVTYFH